MASSTLFISLLRPAVLHILRAAGFHGARGIAADSLVDIAHRYLILLAEKTAEHAQDNGVERPSLRELRMALEDVGALSPGISAAEEQQLFDDDLRGLQAFETWLDGDVHKQMRRIAGLEATSGEINLDIDGEREDFLSLLKKKHSKTGEESKFQGTALGKHAADKLVRIEGNDDLPSLGAWSKQRKRKLIDIEAQEALLHGITAESSPLSDAMFAVNLNEHCDRTIQEFFQ